jgi:Zn-dependent protease with chaperone function
VTWNEAIEAMDGGDFAKAAFLYAGVLSKAPAFVAAQRRECSALAAVGRRDEALRWCRSALATEASPENQAALAGALLSSKGAASASDAAEAKALATSAAKGQPDQAYSWAVLSQAAIAANDPSELRRATDQLLRLAPDSPEANLLGVVAANASGDNARARELLERARRAGLADEQYYKTRDALDASARGSWWGRALSAFGLACALWVGTLATLLIAGWSLSRATLAQVAQQPTEAAVRPGERRLRRVYRGLLWCAGAFYYASLPLLAVAVLAATGGVILAVVAFGFIAVKLFVILAIVGFGSLVAIGRSLFVRVRAADPGLALDLAGNPKVRAVLDEVASRVGAAPVDRVFITPFTEVAVFDRGSLGAQLRGRGERCLILGAGVLEGMRVRALKSVLAHEYGHFKNEDTAGGGLALSVRRSLTAMTYALVAQRVASNLNVAWWFVKGFSRAFYGISQGASRLQEVLADRAAAFAYGSAAFEEGLRHVITRTVRFDAHVNATLEEVIKSRAPLPNLYAFAPERPAPEDKLDNAVGRALERAPSPYDSHPRPEDRLEWVRALGCEGGEPGPDDDAEAWSLFADRAAVEGAMTAEVRVRLRANKGIEVSGG